MRKTNVVLIVNAKVGSTYGLNIISSQLKKNNVDVKLIYLAEIKANSVLSQDVMNHENTPGCLKFSESIIHKVVELCTDADLVGISLLTSGFFNAIQLTTEIKRQLNSMHVVWGGKHPSINPEECLEYADAVFVGESDSSFADYVNKFIANEDVTAIPGVQTKLNVNSVVKQEFENQLDSLEFPDYGPEGHYLIENGMLRKVNMKDIEHFLLKQYPTMIARGCPMKCTFCTNSAESNRRLRIRSVDNVVNELKHMQDKYGKIKMVMFRDDTIMSLTHKYLTEFAQKWKSDVGLPYSSSGVIPTAVKEKKLELLLDSGFESVKMGIQSGSKRVRKDIFWRPESNKDIYQAAKIFNKLKITNIGYMFITDNPWENEEDRIQTLIMISKLPRPFSLSVYSLNLYPGTELFMKAQREGMIVDPKEWYTKSTMTLKYNYLNMLYILLRYYSLPPSIVKILTQKKLYKNKIYFSVFSKLYAWHFRNISHDGVERKPIKPKNLMQKVSGVLIDVFIFFEIKKTFGKIRKAFSPMIKTKDGVI